VYDIHRRETIRANPDFSNNALTSPEFLKLPVRH
jgi:hypothetical protein